MENSSMLGSLDSRKENNIENSVRSNLSTIEDKLYFEHTELLENKKNVKNINNNDIKEHGEVDYDGEIQHIISAADNCMTPLSNLSTSCLRIAETCNKNVKRRRRVSVVVVPNELSVITSTKKTENAGKTRKRGGKKRKKRQRQNTEPKISHIVPMCKFYLESRCHKGTECEFRHQGPLNLKKEPCKFYIRDGHCLKGEKCIYMHSEFPCKFYFWDKCKQSNTMCRFSHDPLTEETKAALELHITKTRAENQQDAAQGCTNESVESKP
ncbi:hypothetical protein HZS_4206 [Henneguya salminicola]|nr:hypothetical protein HZS_4206 [Henneguya salminicola]